jgi:hypothetical protein
VISADPDSAAYTLGLDPRTPTFLSLLPKNGCRTVVFGKWHLRYREELHPMSFEIEKFVGFVSGNLDHHSHYDRMVTFDWWHGREKTKEEGYSTHLITKHAVRFIEGIGDSLILAHQSQHYPITKAIYTLLSTLGNGTELAAALGVWAMVFLSVAIMGAAVLGGKRGGLFKV